MVQTQGMEMTNPRAFKKQTIKRENGQSSLSWLVWSLGCLFYFYEFFLQVSPSVMEPELSRAFGITAGGFGLLGGVYFYSYSIMQIPAGVLLDRLGPHKLLTFASLICALSTLAFAHTYSFNMALVARFCIGFGSAFAAVGAMKLAANWFPPKKFALLTGLMVAIGMTGAIGGEKPLASLINFVGWRESLNYLGLIGLVLAFLIYMIAQDVPKEEIAAEENQDKKTLIQGLIDVLISLKKVIKNKQLWIVALYGGLVFMATLVFCGLWGVPFLEVKYHFSKEMAATLTSLVFLGWIIGSPTWGIISDGMGKRKPPMVYGTFGALTTLSLVLYSPSLSDLTAGTLLFLFGFFSSGFLPAFSIAKEISCKQNCATALSFMNMMNMIGAAIAQPLIGRLLDTFWLHDHPQGAALITNRIYTANYYELAISILPLGILIALVLLPFIKETNCEPVEN
jgi:sugar phosphate permease